MHIYIGKPVHYQGAAFQIVAFGSWGVRIENGYGNNLSILVVQPDELDP